MRALREMAFHLALLFELAKQRICDKKLGILISFDCRAAIHPISSGMPAFLSGITVAVRFYTYARVVESGVQTQKVEHDGNEKREACTAEVL